jgi:quercetin dioxygenase-like cupin family protein
VPNHAFIQDLAGLLAPVQDYRGQHGLHVATAVDRVSGSSHLIVGMQELEPSGWIGAHLHPHEESVYVLEGAVELWIGGAWRALEASSFALIPTGEPHAWRNPGCDPARWLSVRSPSIADTGSRALQQINVSRHDLEGPVTQPGPVRPWMPAVGRLEQADVPPHGPLSLGGLGHYGTQVRNVSIAMMLDAQRGAVHHALFHVSVPGSDAELKELTGHIHPFEEAFVILEGTTEWQLEGSVYQGRPGDVLWAAAGVQHAVFARGGPARWIEVQAPQPPIRHGFMFPEEWAGLRREVDAAAAEASVPW